MPPKVAHQLRGREDERVAIFIDGSNLYHSLEENCKRADLNFGAFATKLCKGRTLFRTYYYNVLRAPERNPQAYQDQQKFLNTLYNTAYIDVRLGGSKVRGEVAVEKGIDIMIATDLLRFAWANSYDVAILVSGDGDFLYAVQAVKDLGKHVEIAAFPSNLSWELAQAADDRELLTPEYFTGLWSGRGAVAQVKSLSPAEHRRRWWQRGRARREGVGQGTQAPS